MLSLVTAAEYQHRFDSASRARERDLLRSIREREASLEARAAELARVADRSARPARRVRAARPRPIGLRLDAAQACCVA